MKDVWNYNATVIHPLGAFVLITCAFLILALNRKWVFLPILTILCFISDAQRINIGGLDFTFARLIVIVTWIRIFFKSEHQQFKFAKSDMLLLMWLFARSFIYSIQWGNREAVIYQLGEAFTTCGFYFMARVFIQNSADIKQFGRQLAIVALPSAMFFAIEWLTGKNYFAIFGGVEFITWIRDGRLRCGGAFSHPLIAGYFWGVAIAFIATLYDKNSQHKKIAITGMTCSLMIIVATASSTPVLGVMAGCFAWCVYFVRSKIMHIVIGIVTTIIALHIYMRAPVWHLISRIGIVGGSTGDHRFRLLDAFLRNVSEWFLLGVKSTEHWGYGMRDVTNEFILQGVRGGFVTLVLFVLLITYIMMKLQMRMVAAKNDRSERFVTWNMWAALFMQSAIFFALSIFGQASIMFYISLGATASLSLAPVESAVGNKKSVNKSSNTMAVAGGKKQQKKRKSGPWIMPEPESPAAKGGWL